MEISAKLKSFRRRKGFSQQELASTSGISIRTIQRIEKGLSVGSAFTLTSLAKALGIETEELLAKQHFDLSVPDDNMQWIKLMNLSALSVIAIPLSNIIIPLYIFWKNRNSEAMDKYGRRILSFQIVWTLSTLILMVLMPVILLSLFKPLRGGSIPLAVPVYFISVLLNIVVILRIALSMNDGSNNIERFPNLL